MKYYYSKIELQLSATGCGKTKDKNFEHRTSNVEHRIRMSLRPPLYFAFLLFLFLQQFLFNVRCSVCSILQDQLLKSSCRDCK
jgi:hypothetical protein